MTFTKTFAAVFSAALLAVSCNNSVKAPVLENFTYDAEEFQKQYSLNKAEWDAALEFIARTDLDTLTAGPWHQLTPNTRGRVQEVFTKAAASKFEIHRNVVDLFYVLDGVDRIALSKFENLEEVGKEYNEEKDFGTYMHSSDSSSVVMGKGQGILIFPPQGHCSNLAAPAPDSLRIVVIKIPYVNEAD